MKIYANREKGWFHGLGDLVVFAWLGEGIRQAGSDCEFYATGEQAEVLKLFGQTITTDSKDAAFTNAGYETAVKENSPLNYIQWIAKHLGVTDKPARPKLEMDSMNREHGRKAAGDVLIFPHGIWSPRVWPKNYFVELGLLLRDEGYKVRFVMKERDYAFFMPFHCIVGKPWAFIAGAVQSSKLVIGNDSGPAHFAGTIGTKTIAIHGPTQGKRIFGHLQNEVISVEKKSIGCGGCHCLNASEGGAWRASCEIGCHELYRTFPEEVFELAVSILGRKKGHLLPMNEPLETPFSKSRELVAA